MKPLIVVDVDGVLNPQRPSPGYREHIVYPYCEWWNGEDPLAVWLNKDHGPWLTDLADATSADLVWGTGWGAQADFWIAPSIGLPGMRVISMHGWDSRRCTFGHWKARRITAWAHQRPFVWFDDEPDARARSAQYARGPHLVVEVNPQQGLTLEHIQEAQQWLTNFDMAAM